MKTPAELFSLDGKVAVVIGGTGELCGAMAEGFAAAGATVVIVGRDAAKAKTRLDHISRDGGKAQLAEGNKETGDSEESSGAESSAGAPKSAADQPSSRDGAPQSAQAGGKSPGSSDGSSAPAGDRAWRE